MRPAAVTHRRLQVNERPRAGRVSLPAHLRAVLQTGFEVRDGGETLSAISRVVHQAALRTFLERLRSTTERGGALVASTHPCFFVLNLPEVTEPRSRTRSRAGSPGLLVAEDNRGWSSRVKIGVDFQLPRLSSTARASEFVVAV